MALIVGSLSLHSCTESQSSARARKVSEEEVCAMQLRLLQGGELRDGGGLVTSATAAPADEAK